MAVKERSVCRRVILVHGLKPFLVNSQWDGRRCLNPNGTHSTLSDGMRRQMKLMLAEGCWSESESPIDPKDATED